MSEEIGMERISEHVGFEERVMRGVDIVVDTGHRGVEEVAREVAA